MGALLYSVSQFTRSFNGVKIKINKAANNNSDHVIQILFSKRFIGPSNGLGHLIGRSVQLPFDYIFIAYVLCFYIFLC